MWGLGNYGHVWHYVRDGRPLCHPKQTNWVFKRFSEEPEKIAGEDHYGSDPQSRCNNCRMAIRLYGTERPFAQVTGDEGVSDRKLAVKYANQILDFLERDWRKPYTEEMRQVIQHLRGQPIEIVERELAEVRS